MATRLACPRCGAHHGSPPYNVGDVCGVRIGTSPHGPICCDGRLVAAPAKPLVLVQFQVVPRDRDDHYRDLYALDLSGRLWLRRFIGDVGAPWQPIDGPLEGA